MLDSVLPTPVKLTHSEILFSAAATLVFQVIEKGGRPIIRLSRLCEKPQYGYTASAQAEWVGPRFLRITDIKAGSVDWKNVPYCDCPEPEKYLLKPGDILVARSGSVGKSFLVSECPEPTVFASYMIRMRAKPGVLAGYVYWYLQTQQFWFQIKESKRGSAMKNINSKMLSSARIPDATPSQQKAVVSFLTWFQNRIDEDYKTPPPEVPELLDVPRIVARIEELAALIEEARGLRQRATKETGVLITAALRQVFSSDFEVARPLSQIAKEGGEQVSASDHSGEIYLSLGDIEANTGDILQKRSASAAGVHGNAVRFNTNSVLFSKLRPYLNKVVVPAFSGIGTTELVVLEPDSEILERKFFAWFLRSPKVVSKLVQHSMGTKMPRANLKVFRSLMVPIPPLAEQHRIVAYLDGLQAQVDELTALQDATQAELDALLPSVLDRAFRGEVGN